MQLLRPPKLPHIPLFRIWYSSTFTVLFALLLCLLAVTPIDHSYQSVRASQRSYQIQTISIIVGFYVLLILIALFMYASRLYTNRSVLASIPKSYIPIQYDEVHGRVRRMIIRALERSAIIAWDSRPRDTTGEVALIPGPENREHSATGKLESHSRTQRTMIPMHGDEKPWGTINHPGWSSPASAEYPNLRFWLVVKELPNLIEAKAVSLAPADPLYMQESIQSGSSVPLIPDERAVALLQRPSTVGLRGYLSHLSRLGLIDPDEGAVLLSYYEFARFSTSPLPEADFHDMMDLFSDILADMTSLDPLALEEMLADAYDSETTSSAPSSIDTDASDRRYVTPMLPSQPFGEDSSSTRSILPYDGSTQTTFIAAPGLSEGATEQVLSSQSSSSELSTGSVQIHRPHHEPQSNDDAETTSLHSVGSVIRRPTAQRLLDNTAGSPLG